MHMLCTWSICFRAISLVMNSSIIAPMPINTLRSRQNGHLDTEAIFKCIFLNENFWFSNKNSLIYVPGGQIDNLSALVQIMAWCQPGSKPLSEPMMVSLLMHICITQPQWVKQCWRIWAKHMRILNYDHRQNKAQQTPVYIFWDIIYYLLHIQFTPIITWSNMIWYLIQQCSSGWGRI